MVPEVVITAREALIILCVLSEEPIAVVPSELTDLIDKLVETIDDTPLADNLGNGIDATSPAGERPTPPLWYNPFT